MCFSPAASIIAGTALSAIGVYTLRKVRVRSELPYAAIPGLFGVQQLFEGLVWLSFDHTGMVRDQVMNSLATHGYVLFSHVLWPVCIPWAVYRLEKDTERKQLLGWCVGLGALLSLWLLGQLMLYGVSSRIGFQSIMYMFDSRMMMPYLIWVYIAVTCGSCVISSHRLVKMFGVALFVSLAVAYMMYQATFASVWCFFAAILSVLVTIFILRKRK